VRLVLDTNIFIAIIGKKSPYRWIFDGILGGRFELCLSNEILLEYLEILEQKTNSEVSHNIGLFLSVHPQIKHVTSYYNWNLIEADGSDNKFVDCALAADALLVSNDKHFKILKETPFPSVLYLDLKEFIQKYQ